MRGEPITRSFEIAADRCADLTPLVYARLFRDHPEMERLFWRDTSGNVRGEMLARVIEAILDFVGPRHYAQTLIQCEVITHEGYDVPPEVFGTFFATVAATLREVCGAEWTADVDDAWRETLAALAYYVENPDQYVTANDVGQTAAVAGV